MSRAAVGRSDTASSPSACCSVRRSSCCTCHGWRGVVYVACLPLIGFCELYQNEKFYSLELPESIATWIFLAIIALAVASYLSHSAAEVGYRSDTSA